MSAIDFEARRPVVIEQPVFPRIRIVARLTIGTQPGFVHIVTCVAGIAVALCRVVDRAQVTVLTLDGGVHAVHADSGARAWRFETESEVRASPVVAEGRVLVGSYDQFLYAVF